MSKLAITNIIAPSEKEPFLAPFRFQITLDVQAPLIHPLTLMVTYVGCAENSKYDQTLEQIEVTIDDKGSQFCEIVTNPVNPSLIPSIEDLLGPTVIILSAIYKEKEFFRCSYFINNSYQGNEYQLQQQNIDLTLVDRIVLVDQPRVHYSEIDWNDEADQFLQSQLNFFNPAEISKTKQDVDALMNNYQDALQVNHNSFLGRFT